MQNGVSEDKYSSSVKTYHVIDHLIARGEELGLMGVPSYLAAIEALEEVQLLSRWPQSRGFAGERRVFYAIKHIGFGFEQLVNAELDYEGEHDEFDQILVSRQGLCDSRVKNYSSSAAIGSDGIPEVRGWKRAHAQRRGRGWPPNVTSCAR